MNIDKPHFLARRIENFQRSNTRSLACLGCPDGGSIIVGEARFLDHAKSQHPELTADAPDGPIWKEILAKAASKAYVKSPNPF